MRTGLKQKPISHKRILVDFQSNSNKRLYIYFLCFFSEDNGIDFWILQKLFFFSFPSHCLCYVRMRTKANQNYRNQQALHSNHGRTCQNSVTLLRGSSKMIQTAILLLEQIHRKKQDIAKHI